MQFNHAQKRPVSKNFLISVPVLPTGIELTLFQSSTSEVIRTQMHPT